MQFGFTILYVTDVRRSVEFYEQAFGLKPSFVDEKGDFASMSTGSTSLSFCSRSLLEALGKSPSPPNPHRPVFEIAFTTDDVAGALARALSAGATLVQDPQQMSWGQTVAYVSDPEGFGVEICTPVG